MQNKIVVIGEAWGAEEEKERTPFIGASGYHLTKMLEEAGINRVDCFLTNVFNLRPSNNKIEDLCGTKAEGIKGYPALIKGKHVRTEFQPELDRLADELIETNPNLIIALGNTACWALLGRTAITKLRGTTTLSTHTVSGFKVLPTYHPAAILRQWELRPTTIFDLIKAKRESESPDVIRPKREIWIEPSIEDILRFQRDHISKSKLISVDIETAGTQITCIGIAVSPQLGIVIPFLDGRKVGRSFWGTKEDERRVWEIVRDIISTARIAKVMQNGVYDISFMLRSYGIKTYGATHDTMLLHHALQPESLKGLGFLGSLYTDEGAWKHMREKTETIKRDS